jgi:hypothetical protein
MVKLRFRYNESGLWLEYYKDSQWRVASVIYNPEDHGGIANLKTKILYAVNPHLPRWEVMPAGDYKEGDGYTVTCV